MKSRAPSLVGEVLDDLVDRLEFRDRLLQYAVFPIWDQEVGSEIAARTEPLRIEDGKLFVRVANSAWMQELHFLKDGIRERLNRRVGAKRVREIFLVLGGVAKPAPPPPPPPAVYEVDEEAIAALPSSGVPEIDGALRRLARAHGRRRGPTT